MHRLWVGVVFLFGCGGNAPYCSEFLDLTGRPAAFCPGPRDEPVCDLPGERAHFEDGTRGLVLAGAERASCDADFEVVCPRGTVGDAYCITDPEK